MAHRSLKSSLKLLSRAVAPAAGVALALAGIAPASASGTHGWHVTARVAEPAGSQTVVNGVVATGTQNAWAVGYVCTPGPCVQQAQLLIEQWTGTAWQSAPTTGLPSPLPAIGEPAAIGASSASDAWVFAYPPSGPAVAYQWNGTAWSQPMLPSWFPNGTHPLSVQVLGSRVWVFSLFRTRRHPFAAVYDTTTQTWAKVPLKVDPTAVSVLSATNMWLTGLTPATARYAAPVLPSAVSAPAAALAPSAAAAGRPAEALASAAARRRHRLAEAAVHWNGTSWRRVRMPSPYLKRKEVYIPIAAAATSARHVLVQGLATSRNGSHFSQSLLRLRARTWRRVKLPYRKYGIDIFAGAMAQDGHGGAWIPAIGRRVWLDHYTRGHWVRASSPRYQGRRVLPAAFAWIPWTRSLWGVGAAGGSHAWGMIIKNGP